MKNQLVYVNYSNAIKFIINSNIQCSNDQILTFSEPNSLIKESRLKMIHLSILMKPSKRKTIKITTST